jgi:hypothetical protein
METVKDTTEQRLREMVANIVNDIEQGIQAETAEDYDGQYEKGETISGFDYLSDILDIEYYLSSDRETCLGARILVAFGGPNIWIDTRKGLVEGYWWGDSCVMAYHHDEMGIDDTVIELWGC